MAAVESITCEEAESMAGKICATASESAQSECQLLELVGEFDAVNAVRWWDGVKSLAHWLSWSCSMSPGTAREHVRVALPFHSLHYTPHYLALALGCFEREGVEVEQTIPAHGVARALLTGDADVGLSGPMRALGTMDRGEGQLVCLAEVASRAAFFLLGRTPAPDFAWRDLSGRRVLAFAEAATPRLCLEYLLDRHGVRGRVCRSVRGVHEPALCRVSCSGKHVQQQDALLHRGHRGDGRD